jgi:hypothetical protein
MSSRLTSDTRIYAEKAKDLNRQVWFCWLHLPFRIYIKVFELNLVSYNED